MVMWNISGKYLTLIFCSFKILLLLHIANIIIYRLNDLVTFLRFKIFFKAITHIFKAPSFSSNFYSCLFRTTSKCRLKMPNAMLCRQCLWYRSTECCVECIFIPVVNFTVRKQHCSPSVRSKQKEEEKKKVKKKAILLSACFKLILI